MQPNLFDQINELKQRISVLERYSSVEGAYPIGSIYISTVATNPSELLGFGTWVAFGAGRTLVGIDPTQTEFDTVEETGGAKTVTLTSAQSGLPAHTHNIIYSGNSKYLTLNTGGSNYNLTWGISGSASNEVQAAANTAANASSAHNNLQPYIVVYMWKRTA